MPLGKVVGVLVGIFLVGLLGVRSMVTPVAARSRLWMGREKVKATRSGIKTIGGSIACVESLGRPSQRRTRKAILRHKELLARLAGQQQQISALQLVQKAMHGALASQGKILAQHNTRIHSEAEALARLDKTVQQAQAQADNRHQALEGKDAALQQASEKAVQQLEAHKASLDALQQRAQQLSRQFAATQKILFPLPATVARLVTEKTRKNKEQMKRLVAESEARSWMFTRIAADLKAIQEALELLKKFSTQTESRLREMEKDAKTFRMAVDNVSSTLPSAMQILKSLGERLTEQEQQMKQRLGVFQTDIQCLSKAVEEAKKAAAPNPR